MQRFDLKRFRLDRKLTQKELAEILMCKQNYISNIENGIVEKDKEIERLNRLIGRLQNEIEELKKGSAQTENPAECANAV